MTDTKPLTTFVDFVYDNVLKNFKRSYKLFEKSRVYI